MPLRHYPLLTCNSIKLLEEIAITEHEKNKLEVKKIKPQSPYK